MSNTVAALSARQALLRDASVNRALAELAALTAHELVEERIINMFSGLSVPAELEQRLARDARTVRPEDIFRRPS